MDLNGGERRKLREAIISAYPSDIKLKMMVSDELEENLNAISGGENLEEIVFELINWAEAKGKLKLLIDAACQSNPGNPDLQAVRKKIHKQELQEILNQLKTEEEFKYIKKAYQYCAPGDWFSHRDRSDNLTEIIKQILEMSQGESSYTRLERFVAYLITEIEDSEIDESVISDLERWAKENIKDFSILLEQIKKDLEQKDLEQKYPINKSYLLIVIHSSKQSNLYTVEAWIILDFHSDKKLNFIDYKPLHLIDYEHKLLEINQIPNIIQKILNESANFHPKNLTIEIFLPFDILNYEVDRWQLDDDLNLGIDSIIGQVYEVVIRSYERLVPTYNRRRMFWEQKWQEMEALKHISAYDGFCLGNENLQSVISQLRSSEIIGLKVPQAPQTIGKVSILAAILETAIPVALWLRKDLKNINSLSEIDNILNFELEKLPEVVKDKRSEAQNPDTDIGYHISLLWENPYRLPPTNQLKLD